jgi:lipopolysaccharide export system permease protein
MKTVRRLLYRQIAVAVAFTTIAFLSLFFFFDLVEELQDVGRNGMTVPDAFLAAALAMPRHLYDVFPITLLIGSISALTRLAQTSEFTILRTGGLSPVRALRLLMSLATFAMLFMLFCGEWLVPQAEQWSALHSSNASTQTGLSLQRGGAWMRDQQSGGSVTVNVGAASDERHLHDIRIFMTDKQGRLTRQIYAKHAEVQAAPANAQHSVWTLSGVTDAQWTLPDEQAPHANTQLRRQHLAQLQWPSHLSAQVIAASVLPIESMPLASLWRYSRHLLANAQSAQKYELQFWKKLLAPLACLVMVSLALPFAYLHARQGGMTLKIFFGIMLGISFVLVNHVSSHLALLHGWVPWIAAAFPSLVYTSLAMGAFAWLVKYR